MLYKNFNKTLKTTILITLSNCRIIANPNECLTLCCPCLNDEIEIENKVKSEIEKFLNEYRTNENYKKEKNKSGKSLLESTLENYITAFKNIDNKLGSFFKNNKYVFYKNCIHNKYCIFYFFYKNEIKDILQIGDYCVTFDTEKKNSHLNKDLVEALSIKEDDEIKYFSDDIKKLKENNKEVDEEGAHDYLSADIYIYSNEDKKYIGGILFQPKNSGKDPLTFNIAYWLNYNYRGLGIMSVIVPTICKYFFTRIKQIRGYSFFWDKKNSKSAGLAEKTCNFIKKNSKSAGLAEKTCNFIRTGHEKKYEIENKYYEDKEEICITKK